MYVIRWNLKNAVSGKRVGLQEFLREKERLSNVGLSSTKHSLWNYLLQFSRLCLEKRILELLRTWMGTTWVFHNVGLSMISANHI